jgi:heme/copper-type cytochrome/quinol oxidase subunit 3
MEIPFTVKPRPDTGLWNAKVGIWLFLASEVMLFGGLFSAYIFLRIGADFPWPVHVLKVPLGFINTFVLIFSSVTVLQAWLALKMRQYQRYKVWMALTILCALGFLVIKAFEYNDKFHHYGVRLQDGSMLEGHLPNNEYHIKFGEVSSVTLATHYLSKGLFNINLVSPASDAGFLKFVTDGRPEFKDASGKIITLNSAEIDRLVAEASKKQQPSIKLTAVAPLKFSINPSRLADYTTTKAVFKDGTEIEGKLEDDTLRILADRVDLRRLFPLNEERAERALEAVKSADAWRLLPAEWKEKFLEHNKAETEAFHKKHAGQNPMANADFVRDAFSMEISLHEGGGHAAAPEAGAGHKSAESAGHDNPHAESGAHHDHPEVAIPKKEVAFYSNFTPKYNNYYAIYFALTGLHGLHVLAGAIVLTYMLFFGSRIYKENPEHQANRVETAGLFWHFVDLVWIFLFPLLYLM